MDKADPENELQILANELTRANTHFHFAERLNAHSVHFRSANEFWVYTLNAHASIALLNLCRVYDYSDKGINLLNCLKSIDEPALDPAHRKQLTDYIARCRRNSNDRLVVSLRTWRNDVIAHYNKKVALDRVGFDKDNPIGPDEMLLNLIPTGFTILEWCSQLHGKVTTYPRFAPGIDSCEKVLECMTISSVFSASPLDEFKDFEEVRIENLDSPDLAQVPPEHRLTLKFASLMQQGIGIKFDDFHVPNLTALLRKQIRKNGYRHKVKADMHFLIPPNKPQAVPSG